MKPSLATACLLAFLVWAAPAAAHFAIVAPTEGAEFAPGDTIELQIDVLVHHDPGESFDIVLIDGNGAETELAAELDDTDFPRSVVLPDVGTSHVTLRLTQHGPEGYRYDQSVDIRVRR